MITSSLLLLLLKKREALHVVGMKGKLLPMHLDGLTYVNQNVVQKNKLKKQ